MNRNNHKIAGALAGAGVHLAHKSRTGQQPTFFGTLFAALAGSIGGTIPDDLEPPDNPNHRGPCHSVSAGIALLRQWQRLSESGNIPPHVKDILESTYAGYMSHLLLDATTPKGLPLFGR